MLIKMAQLKLIKEGKVSLLFRKWKRPRVKENSLIHSPVGQLKIERIQEIPNLDVPESDLAKAGFLDHDELEKSFPENASGTVFRIEVSYYGEDPREALRNESDLSSEQIHAILGKLEKMDRLSKDGPWTAKVLSIIESHPATLSSNLSTLTGMKKEKFKPRVRKLKNIGLTISLEKGYRLSPEG